MRTDSLRAALDATVLSPAGRAAGVDDLGRVVGVTSYDRLRTAIHTSRRIAPERGSETAPVPETPVPDATVTETVTEP